MATSTSSSYDPYQIFSEWYEKAKESEPADPNAMALATVSASGHPSVRMVLLKDFDRRGFVFYTNLESRKGQQLLATPHAALCFHWKSLKRQIRVEGTVNSVEEAEADAYFASRPRGSQIGAWASLQSRPLESALALEKRVAYYTAKFGLSTIPRPPYWSGFRLVPNRIEFWQDRPFRLHERQLFIQDEDGWAEQRLFP